MLSNKPYLIRAFYEWIVDSGCTPHLVVDPSFPKCKLPEEFMKNSQVTLNISPAAIRDFEIRHDLVRFRASFSGIVYILSAPIDAVLGIFSEETHQGISFDPEEVDDSGGESDTQNLPLPGWSKNAIDNKGKRRVSADNFAAATSSEKKQASHLRLIDSETL